MTLSRLLLDLAAPLAMLACLAAFAGAVDDPVAAAEIGYLAVLATAVLVPLACLPQRTPWAVEAAALLTTTAIVALPPEGTRGATVGLLLVACAALEIGRGVKRWSGREGEAPPWTLLLASALALQMLLRAERLLAPELDPRTLIGLVGLPLAGAAAVRLLWARFGGRAAGAAALLLALAPGFRVASTLTLLALAGAARLDPRPAARPAANRFGRLLGERRIALALLVATVAAAALWRPAFGALLALAAAALGTRGRPRLALGVAAAAAAGALLPAAPGSWEGAAAGAALWLLLVPLVGRVESRRLPSVLAALALGIAGHRWLIETPVAWAPAVAVAALVMRLPAAEERLGRLWAGLLVFGAALLAGYPWLRARPLEPLLERLGLAIQAGAALAVAAGAALTLLLLARLARRGAAAPAPTTVGLAVLAAALLLAVPAPGVAPLGNEVFVLDRASAAREAAVDPPARVSELVADTYLSNGIQVEAGRTVARVTLTDEAGTTHVWPLAAGADTGEWAIRRPDVAALGLAAPSPWLSWVAPGPFFAQRYRARQTAQGLSRVTAARIELADDLPPDVALAVFRLDLRP